MADYAALCGKIFKMAENAGFSACEVYYRSGVSFGADVFEGSVKEYKNTNSEGVSFRGNTKHGKTGYAYTEKLTDEALEFLIKGALQNAAVSDEEPEVFTENANVEDIGVSDDAREPQADIMIEKAKLMEETALSCDKRVVKTLHSYMGYAKVRTCMANTQGLSMMGVKRYATAYLYAEAQADGMTKTGGEFFSGRDFTGLNPEALAKTAAAKACSLLGARDIATGVYDILFDNITAGEFLSCFREVFYAENVQRGFSLLSGDKGTGRKIASGVLSLYDYPVHDKSSAGALFDDEGSLTKDKAVIENGVLLTLLHNKKTAAKDGATATTGNGFKASFKSNVKTDCINFFISPSGLSEAELISSVGGSGVYITNLSGLHAGVNAVSGEFSLKADGFFIEGGSIAYPIENFTIAGNFYDFLTRITATADNLRFGMPDSAGAIGAPSVLVSGLSVAGGLS